MICDVQVLDYSRYSTITGILSVFPHLSQLISRINNIILRLFKKFKKLNEAKNLNRILEIIGRIIRR